MSFLSSVFRLLRRLVAVVVEPLKTDDSMKNFTLAIPEAQTTTVDSVQGWDKRPPAVVRCKSCEAEVHQATPKTDIHCMECRVRTDAEEFSDHEVVGMICPRCETEMRHGIRHPNVIDIPEWATCPNCQYHWDLDHWF